MQILAMDTATSACSVALWRDGEIVERRFEAMTRGQAEALAPMIRHVLDAADVAAQALDLVAVTVGPGAFTGLRIGLATARGLSLAAGVACLGLTTTEVIAAAVDGGAWPDGGLLVALDSKRSDLYVQTFSEPGRAGGEPCAMEPEDLGPWLAARPGLLRPLGIVGDAGAQALAALAGTPTEAFIVEAPDVPDAAVLAELAARRWPVGEPLNPPSPLYLRPPDAKLPRNGGRLRP